MSLFKNFNLARFKKIKPPGDKSIATYSVLKQLENIKGNRDFVERKDEVYDVFKEVTDKYDIEYPGDLVNDLIEKSSVVIMKLKNYINRPRPKDLAEQFNIKLDNYELNSMKTPSYPSGHSAQGILVARVLSDKYPIAAEEFLKAGKDISFSRNVAKAHYKSDSALGEMLGNAMYKHVKDKV